VRERFAVKVAVDGVGADGDEDDVVECRVETTGFAAAVSVVGVDVGNGGVAVVSREFRAR
jgi:hypothetical protein